jgi:hypothetical protein
MMETKAPPRGGSAFTATLRRMEAGAKFASAPSTVATVVD